MDSRQREKPANSGFMVLRKLNPLLYGSSDIIISFQVWVLFWCSIFSPILLLSHKMRRRYQYLFFGGAQRRSGCQNYHDKQKLLTKSALPFFWLIIKCNLSFRKIEGRLGYCSGLFQSYFHSYLAGLRQSSLDSPWIRYWKLQLNRKSGSL